MSAMALASDDGEDDLKVGAAALVISAATAICALAATQLPDDRLGGWAQP